MKEPRKIVINDSEFLPGCPTSWDEANQWVDQSNSDKEEFCEPLWGFDCGYKLDFDGPLISVSSRFYPPTKCYGPGWDGTVTILKLGIEIKTIEFECETLDELKMKVEKCIKNIAKNIVYSG